MNQIKPTYSLSEKLIWQVERHLNAPTSLEDLAMLCVASPEHLARAFQSSCGMTPIKYLRARRLTQAAKRLADKPGDILTVAMDAQFNSHEAFTRAFKRQFGRAPSQITSATSLHELPLMEPLKMNKNMIIDVPEPKFQDCETLRIVGLSDRFHRETIFKIPELWGRFNARLDELEEADLNSAYGVCCEPEQDGSFRYVTGVVAPGGLALPSGMGETEIPAGRHAVFDHIGHISDLPRTVYTIWNKTLCEARIKTRRAPDFERYDARFDGQTGRGLVEIWIPVV